MKHLFIINPTAGKKDVTKKIKDKIYSIFKEDEVDVVVTDKPLAAEEYSREYCINNANEEVRIYSCGGDGTLNEVVNGIYGLNNVSVAAYPSGSGNDFIKYFGEKADYLDINNLVNGEVVEVDLIKYNGRYGINVFNMGFDGDVAERMIRYKRFPLVTGKGAYMLGVIVSFFKKITRPMEVIVDGEIIYKGSGTLAAVANSICYGGSFYCAPKAKVDDGLLDVIVVKKINRLKFLKLIKYYKNGTHLEEESLKDIIIYKQGTEVRIKTENPINFAIDGEMGKSNDISVTVVPRALKFVVARKN